MLHDWHTRALPPWFACAGECALYRDTTDAGAPRKRLALDSGVVPAPRDLAKDLAVLNHAARLAKDDVFLVTDDVADFFPHRSLAPTEYWFSTLATLLLPGDAGFSGSDSLDFVAEYVLGFGLLCASNYAQRLSAIFLALLRVEFAHFVGQHNPATLAWLKAREQHLGVDDARMHTALMYTDDI
eukprot:6205926-Pleurochrysis_carterae.AAC.1